jgi:predicted metal-dependent enzyme (double-stranded beta helix superfamily)
MPMQVHELVSLLTAAAAGPNPAAAVQEAMEGLRGDLKGLAATLAYLPGTGGNARQAFYRAPDLSILKVNFPNGRRTPPHDHGTWATILLLAGGERNTVYRRGADGRLVRDRVVELKPGDIIHVPADCAHVAECAGSEPAIGLHVYGANVLGVERSMWDPETMQELPLDWTQYEPLAQKASAMASAP